AKNKISENYCAIFELERALKIANEALVLSEQHLTEYHLEKANAYSNRGNVYYLTGRHEDALAEYNEALRITESVENDEKQLYSAPTNLGIGNVYYGKLQYEEAFRYFKNALETNRSILGDDHPYVANSYLSLGNLYRNKGSYNLAKDHYDRALEINQSVFGDDHPDVATTYVGIGDIFKSSGALDAALQYYNQALIIYSRFLDTRNPKFGAIYLGFADVAKNKGDYQTALENYQQALEVFQNTVGEVHQSAVRSYLGIANTYIYQEEFLKSLEFYGKVLDINFNLVGEDHVNTSAAYNNLGSLYYFAGDFDLAVTYFKKALRIDENIHGAKHPNIANAYYNIARVLGYQGKTQEALEAVQAAINASLIDFNDQNIFVNPALTNFFDSKDLLWFLQFKGELLESGFSQSRNMKGLDISLHSFVLSDSLVDQIRKSYTDRDDQVLLAQQAHKIYESSVNGAYAMVKLLTPENVRQIGQYASYEEQLAEYKKWYFYFTEKNKGSILFSSLAEANAKSFGGIPDTLVDREVQLKKEINQLTQELSANPDSAQRVHYQDQLFKANRAYEDLVLSMERDFPKYYDLKYDVGVVDPSDLQRFLSDSTLMVSYFLTDDSLYANYITNEQFDIHKVALDPKYEQWIQAFRKSIIYQFDKLYIDYGRKLYQQLFPREIPKHIKKIVVVLDGMMATIPFEALLTEEVTGPVDYSQLPYMVNDYALSYTFSANLLYKTFRHEKTVQEKATKASFTLAPVTFDAPYLTALEEKKRQSYDEAGTAQVLRKGLAINRREMVPLPGSEQEVIEIDSAFERAGKPSDLYMREGASEGRVKDGDLHDYNYLHIASHGFVNQDEPEFSGILLAADSAGVEDGILFSGEVYDLDLNAELVTLSACETGLGKISTGEGIIGLTRALIYAGTKNVNVSLWKVSDASTRNLMIGLYDRIAEREVPKGRFQSLDYSEYLQATKLALIEEGSFAKPYYWSPFVLIGK
ncbi:MAG: CHAT domain-containing tetratricopeptide repeat protein, partial [Bacteroidota bacterium]